MADGTLGRAPLSLRSAASAAENFQAHIYSPPFHLLSRANATTPVVLNPYLILPKNTACNRARHN